MLRIGDAERDECVDHLIEHHVHGRLGVQELASGYVVPYSDVSQFAVALGTGILGYATHWAVSRHRR